MSILKFEIMYNTTTGEFCVTDTETGEMKTTGVKKTITRKTKPAASGSEPKIILAENKYCITESAAELLGVEAGDKLDIQYDKTGPIIANEEIWGNGAKGNKLTKSLTVACRGVKREELEKYGTEFTLVPIPDREGMFYLKGNVEVEAKEDITVEELEELGTPVDEDLQDLIDDPDATTYEIDSSLFKL